MKGETGVKIISGIFILMGLLLLLDAGMIFLNVEQVKQELLTYSDPSASGVPEGTMNSPEEFEAYIESTLSLMGGALLVFGLIYIGVGVYTLKFRNKWSKWIASLLSVFLLMNYPVATIIGIAVLYLLWFHKETKELFEEKKQDSPVIVKPAKKRTKRTR